MLTCSTTFLVKVQNVNVNFCAPYQRMFAHWKCI